MSDRWTWHGGGLRAALARFGESAEPWIDLSTGINPHGWPVPDLPFDWQRLPDEHELKALEVAAAAHFGTAPDHVCALPGTEIGLRLVGGLLTGQARWLAPGYRTHGEMFAQGAPVERIQDADGMTLLLANPNNPDGRVFDRAAMESLLARRGAGWLVVDEAFADADPAVSLADRVGGESRLLIFRSFGKFFGLAGVRLGFLLGPPSFLETVRQRVGAWPVSAAALAIGRAAYADRGWVEAMRHRLRAEAEALDALLARAGTEAVGQCPLFRLLQVDDAPALFDRLARRAILTRPFADNSHWLRVGLPGDAAASERLEAALRDG